MISGEQEIRVRFAPSPTGYLHIGGARTAIFNWLFAKRYHGEFLLRIEDTDAYRSDLALVEQITGALKWLGIDWYSDIIYQSDRTSRYKSCAEELVEQGKAYRCYCSKERLAENKRNFGYNGRCRNLTQDEIDKYRDENKPYAIRLKIEDGETRYRDEVYGSLKFNNAELDDFVILKSDGRPTYHLAVVVDDHDMNISHVIRGADHVSNTPKQILLYRAFNWSIPSFTHVPLIMGSDGKRLSKRHGATSVLEYRKKGYGPDTIFNFLALLGWSPGDDREIITRDELINSFTLEKISKNNAIFDEKKLQWMNGQYIGQKTNEDIVEIIIPLLREQGLIEGDQVDVDYLLKVVDLFKQKVRFYSDFGELGSYFFKDPPVYDEKAQKKHWKNERTIDWLRSLKDELEKVAIFTELAIEEAVRGLAERLGVGAGKLIHPARLALTGYAVSPGLFEMMEVLGKSVVLDRISKAIAYLET